MCSAVCYVDTRGNQKEWKFNIFMLKFWNVSSLLFQVTANWPKLFFEFILSRFTISFQFHDGSVQDAHTIVLNTSGHSNSVPKFDILSAHDGMC